MYIQRLLSITFYPFRILSVFLSFLSFSFFFYKREYARAPFGRDPRNVGYACSMLISRELNTETEKHCSGIARRILHVIIIIVQMHTFANEPLYVHIHIYISNPTMCIPKLVCAFRRDCVRAEDV